MSDLSNTQFLEIVNETLEWGSEVSEMWTGTMYEKQIDRQKEAIKENIRANDLNKVRALVYDLAQFLDNAETAY